MHRIYCTRLLIVLLILLGSCGMKNKEKKFESPEGYDINKPVLIKLPVELDEISGINYYEVDSSLFAISDDRGAIFKIKPGPLVSKWKFSHGADFEDLARIDSTFYILQSNGDVFKVYFEKDKAVSETFKFEYAKNNEFEIIYADTSTRKLIVICKDCETDTKKSLSTFIFDPFSNSFSDSSFTIDINKAESSINIKDKRFKPSAAALNPADGLLYIISSVNKMLMVADAAGNVKKGYPLNPSIFKQPEGIAFKPNGDMIVSNEYAGTGTATLLIFKYQKK